MLPLRWTERAITDLEGIAEFVSRTSAVYAEGVVLRIDQRLQLHCELVPTGRNHDDSVSTYSGWAYNDCHSDDHTCGDTLLGCFDDSSSFDCRYADSWVGARPVFNTHGCRPGSGS